MASSKNGICTASVRSAFSTKLAPSNTSSSCPQIWAENTKGSPVSTTRCTANWMRWDCLPTSNGLPLIDSSISAPLSASVSGTAGNHQSSHTIRPMRKPRNGTGPGAGPASNTRLSSNTP